MFCSRCRLRNVADGCLGWCHPCYAYVMHPDLNSGPVVLDDLREAGEVVSAAALDEMSGYECAP